MTTKIVAVLLLAFIGTATSAQVAKAETIYCGPKTITVQNGIIVQIRHEDGTIHGDISDYWSYDGKSIKHKLMSERISCGTTPKSRDEVIEELSSRFIKNPSLYGMDKQEAQWMTSYTAKLMKTDKKCHLLVDAAKSMQRKDMFYIDCNDSSSNSHRRWVSRVELKDSSSY